MANSDDNKDSAQNKPGTAARALDWFAEPTHRADDPHREPQAGGDIAPRWAYWFVVVALAVAAIILFLAISNPEVTSNPIGGQ